MAPPNREALAMMNNKGSSTSSSSSSSRSENKIIQNKKQLPMLSMDSLQRTISDISLELIAKQTLVNHEEEHHRELAAIPEASAAAGVLEEAKCECCGMEEECTGEYVGRVRAEFGGRVVCGLCAEAVGEEMGRGPLRIGRDEALAAHVSDCTRFTRLGRTHPALFQAEAYKEMLKRKNSTNSFSPTSITKGINGISSGGGQRNINNIIARSSSCIPAIRKDLDKD